MEKKIMNYAINNDEKTLKQFKACYDKDFVISGALMPDAHLGYVAPIGSVLVTHDFVVPSWVGYDIGCGMIACKFKSSALLNQVKENSKMIFDEVNRAIPMGKGRFNNIENISSKTKDEFDKILSRFKEKEHDKNVLNYIQVKAYYHLGTLGSGNHFIEIGFDEKNENSDEVWLIIHSGSRGVGHTLASKYMRKAATLKFKKGEKRKGKSGKFEDTYPLSIESIEGKEYMNILEFGLDFALLNRLEMAYNVRDVLRRVLGEKKLDFELWANKNHNHAVMENVSLIGDESAEVDDEIVVVHRKGATPAKKGERGVIPGNMKDGSFLVEGLGSGEFLMSSSHGAGRALSRREAKMKLNVEEFKEEMEGIVSNACEKNLDESPQAYQDIYKVMSAQENSVEVVGKVVPIINWKG